MRLRSVLRECSQHVVLRLFDGIGHHVWADQRSTVADIHSELMCIAPIYIAR